MKTPQPRNYLIVGGVAGGASIAARLRRLDESARITMLERGRDVSFSNCALPYFLSREVEDAESLKLVDPETFHQRYRISALTHHEAMRIDRTGRRVLVRDLVTGRERELPYDTLFLSPGASPILPSGLPGIRQPHVFSVRNVEDVERIDRYLKQHDIRQVAVIGGGFIGVEVMENLVEAGVKVSLIDQAPQVMLPFDEDMAQFLHKEIVDCGVELILDDGLDSIQLDGVTLKSGRTVSAGAVIMAIGVRPETMLAQQAGLELGQTGAILVDERMQTSDPHIYAVGDAVEVRSLQTGQPTRLALAGPALRQARVAANSAAGMPDRVQGVLGASVLRVFSLNAASVGLNERQCQALGQPYALSFVSPMDKVGIMPGAMPPFFKLLYEPERGRVLGAQAIGRGGADKRVDVVATLLRFGGAVGDLATLELAYSPVFSTARDVVNQAALSACDVREGLVDTGMFSKARALHQQGALFVDVREEDEFELGHIKGAVNIPLSRLRERMGEIPRDRPVYLHCRSGQRSYNAARVLLQSGWERVYNLAGSYMALSWHEFYHDQVSGREPILTDYQFD